MKWTVIGLYINDGSDPPQRFGGVYDTPTAQEAETKATEENECLVVAAVIEGEPTLADVAYA